MTTGSDSPRTRRADVPRQVRQRGGYGRFDHSSAVELTAADVAARSSEQWARGAFEEVPGVVRWLLVSGWAGVLRLRLGPRPSPEHVCGWLIAESGAGSVTLTASSPLLDAENLVIATGPHRLVWVTLVRFRRPIARPLWALAALVHHRVVPLVLKYAARRG